MNLGQFTTDMILEYLKNKKVLTDLEQEKQSVYANTEYVLISTLNYWREI